MYCTYVVARYKVAGNMAGQYKDNVEEGDFSKEVCDKIEEITDKISAGAGDICGICLVVFQFF